MRKPLFTLLALLSLGAAAAPVSLVQNEYDFVAAVAKHGTRDGFLMYLDEQAITLDPMPVNDYQAHQKAKPSAAKLSWYPTWALVSSAGDFGIDTGPWTYEAMRKGRTERAYGEWLTVWTRDQAGAWKISFDSGIDHVLMRTPPQPLAHDASVEQLPVTGGRQPAAEDMWSELRHADMAFSDDAVAKGLRAAYDKSGSDDLRLLLEDHLPVLGKAAALDATPATPTLQRVAVGGSVAHSGDLGYIYGLDYALDDVKRQTAVGSYMHVWRKSADGWKLLIAMDAPFPAK